MREAENLFRMFERQLDLGKSHSPILAGDREILRQAKAILLEP